MTGIADERPVHRGCFYCMRIIRVRHLIENISGQSDVLTTDVGQAHGNIFPWGHYPK